MFGAANEETKIQTRIGQGTRLVGDVPDDILLPTDEPGYRPGRPSNMVSRVQNPTKIVGDVPDDIVLPTDDSPIAQPGNKWTDFQRKYSQLTGD